MAFPLTSTMLGTSVPPVNPSLRFFSFPQSSLIEMEMGGIEPPTSCLQSRRSPTELHPRLAGGYEAIALAAPRPVGVLGFEPRTSALSELRSSQLSYTPDDGQPGNEKSQTHNVWLDPASDCGWSSVTPCELWRGFSSWTPHLF